MGLTKQYKILLPFTVEEYQRGFQWAANEDSVKNNTKIELNESYIDEKTKKKGEHIRKKISHTENTPSLVKKLAPEGSLDMIEERWDTYPSTKVSLTNGYLGDKMKITVHTIVKQDAGTTENPHDLPADHKIETVVLDFLNSSDKNPAEDPSQFSSKVTGRGKLTPTWVKDAKVDTDGNTFGETPVMCIYALVEVEFNVLGMQKMMEKALHEQMKTAQIKHSRTIFCSIDEWHGLSLAEIKAK